MKVHSKTISRQIVQKNNKNTNTNTNKYKLSVDLSLHFKLVQKGALGYSFSAPSWQMFYGLKP